MSFVLLMIRVRERLMVEDLLNECVHGGTVFTWSFNRFIHLRLNYHLAEEAEAQR